MSHLVGYTFHTELIYFSGLRNVITMAGSTDLLKSLTKINSDHELLGFPYYDSFEELWKWKKDEVDDLHKANTPLLTRPGIPVELKKKKSSNVMLLPDYANGYHESGYEAAGGAEVDEIHYNCEYWQYVEVFVYFGHNRAAIPPPVWTNTAHRNGVLILANFCIEDKDIAPMIKKEDGRYKLADVLVEMAECYGFDGWFLNVESNFKNETRWDIKNPPPSFYDFLGFLRQLKTDLGQKRRVVW
jgi:endo-beta-N-acetylglucosaminidase D